VRQLLPEKETVKLAGQTISVDNSWLYPALSEFEKSNSSTERRDVIARIAERLRAIHEHLQELEKVKNTAATDKDGEKGRLAEILRRPEYLQTAATGSALESLLDRFLRWLNKLIPHPRPIQPGGSAWLSRLAQIVIVALCLGGIAILIWRFGPRLLSGRRKKKTKREARIVLGERLEADQTAADLLAQAEHGSGHERVWLVTTSARILNAVQKEIARQLPKLERREFIQRALDRNGWLIQVATMEQGLALATAEHRYTFAGIALYRPEFFADCTAGAFPLKPLLLRSMAAKRCAAQIYSGRWEDVGTPDRWAAMNGKPRGTGV